METNNIERRFLAQKPRIEKRMDGDNEQYIVQGTAAVVEQETSLGYFRERIARGAFDGVLASAELDCRALFNHDPNLILARSGGGASSLSLSLSANGDLLYEFALPNRSYAHDLRDALESGDVSQSSFAFRIGKQIWEWDEQDPNNDLRIITEVSELVDVSPVTYPAYASTSAQVAERMHTEARSLHLQKRDNSEQPAAFDSYAARYMLNKNKSKR